MPSRACACTHLREHHAVHQLLENSSLNGNWLLLELRCSLLKAKVLSLVRENCCYVEIPDTREIKSESEQNTVNSKSNDQYSFNKWEIWEWEQDSVNKVPTL